jgi:hypothetical protein
MRKMKYIGLVLLFSTGPLWAEMVQGGGYSFFLSAPAGWVLDKSMASDAEADAVLYPQGTTYQNAPSVLYVSVADKGDGFKDLNDLIRQDQSSARQQNPSLRLQNGPFLRTHLKKSVPLFLYLGYKDGSGEAVAYVEEADAVVVFTLTSSSEQILHEDLPALQAAVDSYEFIGESGEGLE